ncbi:MAG: HlyC/CorC family transporter [Anaerolineales bacterium]|nr:HlyC/CorC family transporter [Anaerolineales bacterium]
MLFEFVIIILLILTNGLFSMSEMAVVSARKYRLQIKAAGGSKGAASALELGKNPNRFLSTVQVGITLIGILSGAFGGATIAEKIGFEIKKVAWLAPYSEGIGFGIVVLVITYLSLVLGELVPKRLALNRAEQVASTISPLMQALSKVATPIVSLLSSSTNLVLRILNVQPSSEPEITEQDLKSLLDQGTRSGAIEESEQDMVNRIFRLGDQNISSVVTPRTEVIFLDINDSNEEIYQKITTYPFSCFPVIHENSDNIIGTVQSRDLLFQRVKEPEFEIYKVLQEPTFIPESTPVLDVLDKLRASGDELAVIIDEFGGVLGLVDIDDILEALVGDVDKPHGEDQAQITPREDGSWFIDGMIPIDDLKEYLEIDTLPDEDQNFYETLSGMIMYLLGRIPESGDYVVWKNFRFEVADMDRRRVDKVLVTRIEKSS